MRFTAFNILHDKYLKKHSFFVVFMYVSRGKNLQNNKKRTYKRFKLVNQVFTLSQFLFES